MLIISQGIAAGIDIAQRIVPIVLTIPTEVEMIHSGVVYAVAYPRMPETAITPVIDRASGDKFSLEDTIPLSA